MQKQRGVTMIGWIFLLIPVAIVLYGGIRVVPKYLGFYKIVTAMKETASQMKGDETLTAQSIRASLERRFDTGYVDAITVDDMQITKVEGGWELKAEYDETVPLFGNLGLLMAFNESVVID
jgi:hypothetical protein